MVDENEGRKGKVPGIDVLGSVFREWWTGAGSALYGSASVNELNNTEHEKSRLRKVRRLKFCEYLLTDRIIPCYNKTG